MKKRDYRIDLLRVIACIMVIGIHAPQKGLAYSGVFLVGSSYLCEPCIGLFFMISGYLLLPVKLSYKDFISKRLNRVLIPTVCFSVFYIILRSVAQFDQEAGWGGIIKSFVVPFISIPFHFQGSTVLWFMYPLIGIYLIAPIISPFLEKISEKEYRIILLLWLVSLTLKTVSNFIEVSLSEQSILYYFYGYIGYFILGYYLRRFPQKISIWFFPLLILIPCAVCYLDHSYDLHVETWYLSIFGAMQSFAWFQFVIQYVDSNKWPNCVKKWVADFSDCSFGIYLIHSFVLFHCLSKIDLNDYPQRGDEL